jgi:uncharacterized Zn-binding protein involved in type VI secretion
MSSRIVACIGDGGTHSGSITISGQSGNKLYVGGLEVAADGAMFNCDEHGLQGITPIISKTYRGGKLLITDGAVAQCGAVIKPPDRKFYAG